MSGEKFKASIGRWQKKAKASAEALARQACQELAFRVVMATPVDTGFLRGSWQPSLTGPKTNKGGPDPAGTGTLNQIALTIQRMPLGATFYMTNGASYAWFVEAGTSKMAGRYFVKSTLAAWPQIVAAAAKDLKL